MSALISFDAATFRRQSQTVLTDLSWTLEPGQHWAVVGPVGAGKTSFLLAAAGKLVCSRGTARWGSVERDAQSPDQLRRTIVLVNFAAEPRLMGRGMFFYQQRYYAGLADETVLLRDFLFSDVLPSPHATDLLTQFQLTPLLDLTFSTLSNGQMRRALLTRALLKKPRLLLLDYPFTGLDESFRAEFSRLLAAITTLGTQVILVTDAHSLPEFITHVLELQNGSSAYAGPRSAYQPSAPPVDAAVLPDWRQPPPQPDFEVAFLLEDVNVRHGGKLILDTVNWTVRRGEKWVLLGPNGAGKSVLLSLLYGDHPQRYANSIRLFDRPTGSESIWDLKKRIGFVSPELHLYFREPLTCYAVALSGLTDTLTPPRAVTPAQEHDCRTLFRYTRIDALADRLFLNVSTGQQRLVLLIRALLKRPPCLILDEPFQALDPNTVQRAQHLLMTMLTPEQTLILVTHHCREIPVGVTHALALSHGKVSVIPVPAGPLTQ